MDMGECFSRLYQRQTLGRSARQEEMSVQLKNKPDARGIVRRSIAAVGAVAVVLVGIVGGATTAQAAELTPAISNTKVTLGYDPEGTGTEVAPDTEITTNTMLTFHADWVVPGMSNAGDTFVVPVPSPFRIASSDPFNLLQNGATIATCQYSAPAAGIVCTIVGGPHAGAEGSIWFTGRLDPPTDPGETPEWEIGGGVIALPVPTTPPPGAYTPPFGTMKGATSANIVNGKAQLGWAVYMWPGCADSTNTCSDEFHVSDQLESTNPAMPHSLRAGSFILDRWERAKNPDGTWAAGAGIDTGVPGSHTVIGSYVGGVWTVDPALLLGETFGEPVISADGKSYTFDIDNAEVPYQYRLRYFSDADGAISLDNELYQNTATVNGEPKPAQATPRVQGGGGANAGAYTSFVASKQVSNDTLATLPTEYVLTATQGAQTETITVPADGTQINSPYFPASNGDITICEALPDVDGVVWEDYTITGTGVTGPDDQGCYTLAPAGGERIEIVVNNHATPAKVSVGDYTWIDTNRDGVQDAGEPVLPGVGLTLVGPDGEPVTDVNGNAVAPQTTDASGKYLFENLPPLESGSYTVKVTTVPAGYFQTKVDSGSDKALDSSGDEASSYLPLATDGAEDLTLDFGFVTYAPEIDIVKTDVDGNDSNDTDSEVDLTPNGGKTTLKFVVTNTGNEPLTVVSLTDVTSGSGKVENISCEFPDGTSGVTWEGPFEPGDQIECTAELTGVTADEAHRDEAKVTATGVFTGTKVSDDDPYHAKVTKPETPAVVPPGTTPPGLSTTGADMLAYGVGGAVLLGLGAFVLLAARRRKAEQAS